MFSIASNTIVLKIYNFIFFTIHIFLLDLWQHIYNF